MTIEIPLLEIIDAYKRQANRSLGLAGLPLGELINFQFYTKDASGNPIEVPLTVGVTYVRFSPNGVPSLALKEA